MTEDPATSPDPTPMTDPPSDAPAAAAPAAVPPARTVQPPTVTHEGTERMDASVSVVTTQLKIAIGVATVTLLAFVAWAFFAKVTTSTTLSGTVVPPSGFASVTAPAEGFISALNIKVGDTVAAGQVLGTLQFVNRSVDLTAPISGTVTEVIVGQDNDIGRGDVVAVLTPQGSTRAFLAFPDATAVESLVPGQQAVIQVPGCAPLTASVETVFGLPATRDEVSRQLGVPGLATAVMSSRIGFPVSIPVPASWCPDLELGAFGQATVTTGSIPAISLLAP